MDFFEHQEVAKRRTKFLVVYFVLAIIGISLSVFGVLTLTQSFGASRNLIAEAEGEGPIDWVLFLYSTLGTLAVVLIGSGFKSIQLTGGGKVVAQELGGRRVDQQTTNPEERRLLNVVEEMAIASGVPVPEVFILEDENTVNAFAAGKSTSDAVIGVTRGCARMLSRDELQAVIAHEFSHILNGDMRLNMRLMALVFGITALTIVGRVLLRLGSGSREKGAAPFVILGLSLVVIGFLGVLFGRLIQRAVSRQREFLADASAVQFTRNPDGMTGALKKIGALGSRVEEPHAEEASHMMIASALSNDRGSLFATHPPLAARIKAIDPHWDGSFDDVKLPSIGAGQARFAADARSSAPRKAPLRGDDFVKAAVVLSAGALDNVGGPNGVHLSQGTAIHQEFPDDWREATNDTSGAQAVVFALLLAQDDELRSSEVARLQELDEATYRETIRLHGEFGDLHSSRKLALVDLAIASLRRLSPQEYKRFVTIASQLMRSDRQIDLFEFALQKVIKRHLDIHFREAKPAKIRYKQMNQLRDEAEVLLSTLASLCGDAESEQEAAFAAGAGELAAELAGGPLRYTGRVGLTKLDEALRRFDEAAPLLKKRLLHAAGRTVMQDEKLSSNEAELLRAMADTIGVPIPPFVRPGD